MLSISVLSISVKRVSTLSLTRFQEAERAPQARNRRLRRPSCPFRSLQKQALPTFSKPAFSSGRNVSTDTASYSRRATLPA